MLNLLNVVQCFIMQSTSNKLVSFPMLSSLDKFITSQIKKPKCEGKSFMDALEIYNCSIVNLIHLVLGRNEVIAKIATDLRVQGGPLFLKQKINRDKFKKKFQWTNKDIENMFDLRSEISKNWKMFYRLYRKNKEWFKNCQNNTFLRTEKPYLELSRLDFNFTSDEEFDFIRSENFDNEDSSFIFFSYNDELVEDGSQTGGSEKSKTVFCDSETLASFLTQIQVINPESVIALATAKDIDNLCSNVSQAQDKLQKYLKTCTLSPDQENYKHIFSGIKSLHAKLCKDSKYHALFLQYAPCFGKLKSEFDSCTGPADWSENSEGSKVCKAYRDMADCYFLKASVLCGTKAADVFKELVMAVVDSVITVNCTPGEQNTSSVQSDHIVSGACICSSPWYKLIVSPFIDIMI